MSTVSLKSVRKSFGNVEVIHGVDIDIEHGEFIVIVGPSGCGKSTLLRMVAGLEVVTGGEIEIGGLRVNELEPMERNIAMVFQNYALYPHMNVYDNMAYGLRIAGTPKAEIDERVRSAARVLQLEDYLKRKPRDISGGQRQRVAMGRAIVRKPAVFLFDEPLSNLDAKLRVQMRLEIKALQRDLGVTSLYVTHDQVEAMTLADRMVVMNGGAVDQTGPPLDVYHHPDTAFVGGFIGSPPMNFLDGQALLNAGLPGALFERAARVGIRPEHLRIGDGEGRLSGTLKYFEPLGAETLLYVELNSGELLTVRQSGGPSAPPTGHVVHINFDENDLCVFDADGKRRRVEPRQGADSY